MPYEDQIVGYIYPNNPTDWKTAGTTYNCSRPSCAFDLKYFDYYVPKNSDNVESFFEKKIVRYDHQNDYYKWKHIEDLYNKEGKTESGNIPSNGPLFRNFNGYGFNYSTPLGVGNPENVWYTHTDLDLDMMIKIRDEVRGPIVQLITEAKEYENIYNTCRSRQEYEDRLKKHNEGFEEGEGDEPSGTGLEGYIPTEDHSKELWSEVEEWPPITETKDDDDQEDFGWGLTADYEGFTYDCEDYTCKGLEEKINAIPLECELIKEKLGEEWAGCDLNNYWWYGWLPKEWLEMVSNDYGDHWPQAGPSPFGGTGGIPNTQTQGPPYQSIIGSFNCRDHEEKYSWISYGGSETELERDKTLLTGYTADACGCIDDPSDSLPHYMTKCQYPVMGERYPEYLEYVRSVNATYWNQPLKSRLYRQAQMALLFSQRIEFRAPGDLTLRIGDIINIAYAPIAADDNYDLQENLMGGKWLVTKITHKMGGDNSYYMEVSCARDNTSISAEEDVDPDEDELGFEGELEGGFDPTQIVATTPNFEF